MSRPFARIGHGGASALAPGNTLTSFDAALEVGIDMIEFDVRAWRGDLILAHTLLDARRGHTLRLHDALAHLAAPRFGDVEFNVDLKRVGCETALLAELRHSGLLARTLVSSQVPEIIDRLRSLDPEVRTGISIGGRAARTSQRWRDWRAQVLAGLATHRWHALMAQHRLIDIDLLEDVVLRGGLLYAWTVNKRTAISSLRDMGVHGVTTTDPRLFTAD